MLGLDGSLGIEASYHTMNGRLVAKMRVQFFSLVLFFALCQIVGTMCTVPDLSLADDTARMAEEMNHMACPMDGTIMCPPSAVSSPERQLKHAATIDLDHTPVLFSTVANFTASPILDSLSWSSASEFFPISIASSSVLRI